MIMGQTHLVNTLLVEHVTAFVETPGLFTGFEVTQAHEATLLQSNGDTFVTVDGYCDKITPEIIDGDDLECEYARSVGDVLFAGDGWLCRTKQSG